MRKPWMGKAERRLGRPAGLTAGAAAIALLAALGAAMPAARAEQFKYDDYAEVGAPRLLREPIARWLEAEESEDPDRIAGRYAPEGWLKPPCAPVAMGRTAIAQAWREILSLSPSTLSLQPSSFELSRGRDMAIERGWAQFLQYVGVPRATNVAYLRVWRRRGRDWVIAGDLFGDDEACGDG